MAQSWPIGDIKSLPCDVTFRYRTPSTATQKKENLPTATLKNIYGIHIVTVQDDIGYRIIGEKSRETNPDLISIDKKVLDIPKNDRRWIRKNTPFSISFPRTEDGKTLEMYKYQRNKSQFDSESSESRESFSFKFPPDE